MLPYALTIFVSAFLLFQVQPLVGKQVLPWFGGSPAVWTACMLFFQVALLLGYGYAHWSMRWKRWRLQAAFHLLLLIATLLLLPIALDPSWKPTGGESPAWRILAVLTLAVGGPYFILSTSAPLLQAWFSRAHPSRSPYRLYALSNAGSLLGLLTYPFLVEPWLTRHGQAVVWSAVYALFAAGCFWCARVMIRQAPASPASPDTDAQATESPRALRLVYWVVLAACGSTLLLASTNQMCQEVAVVPFLWVLPLALYLVTFIIAFERDRWYRRRWSLPLLAISTAMAVWVLWNADERHLLTQILVYSIALFAGCMTCHGELARTKPAPGHLTVFYLAVASGGAIGGIFVALAAPVLFDGYWEYHLALAGSIAIGLGVLFFDRRSRIREGRPLWAWVPIMLVYSGLIALLWSQAASALTRSVDISRSFYAVMRVAEEKHAKKGVMRQLLHGQVMHGFQYDDPEWRRQSTTYYGEGTGVWMAIRDCAWRDAAQPLRIGAIGLGAGTIASIAGKGDLVRFYEIDPDVVRLSEKWFTFVQDSEAQVEIVVGDARLQLEDELARSRSNNFDVLVADAFNSGSIPMHLLTRESVQIYRRHLKDDGVLAVHISNSHLDLAPVVRALARELGWEAVLVDSDGLPARGVWTASWALITDNPAVIGCEAIGQARTRREETESVLWTDDYGSLFNVLNW